MYSLESNHREVSEDGSELLVLRCDNMNFPPFSGLAEGLAESPSMPIKNDDVIVMGYPRSGNNWVAGMVHRMLHKDKFLDKSHVDVPVYMFLENPKQKLGICTPRIYISHLPPKYLPHDILNSKRGRIISVSRNPKDIVVSYYHVFVEQGIYKGSFASFFKLFLDGKVCYGSWFEHILESNKFVKDLGKQCLSVVYEELKLDPEVNIGRIAAHLGVEMNGEEIAALIDASSIARMKEMFSGSDSLSQMRKTIYRRGHIGDWKNLFTETMNKQFDAVYAERFAGSGISHVFE